MQIQVSSLVRSGMAYVSVKNITKRAASVSFPQSYILNYTLLYNQIRQ